MMLFAAINWHSVLFLLTAGFACIFAMGVLFSSNVVRMAFYLIISLAATAGLFMLAGAKFLGAMQIMIYVGGTLVLLIFGVMLTAQASYVSMKTSGGEWIAGLVVGGAMLLDATAIGDERGGLDDTKARPGSSGGGGYRDSVVNWRGADQCTRGFPASSRIVRTRKQAIRLLASIRDYFDSLASCVNRCGLPGPRKTSC